MDTISPRLLLLAGLGAGLLACTGEPEGPATEELEADGKADADLRVRVDGLTVWIDPAITRAAGDRPWRLRGRTSRNLEDVHGFVPDDAFGTAQIRSPRTFELAFDDHELSSLAAGLPLFVAITPTTGAPVSAAVWLAPRTTAFSGTARLRIDTTVTPRWVGGEVTYRGGARADSGWSLSADGASAPQVFPAPEANRYRLDWRYPAFARGATEPFRIHAQRGDEVGTKEASARFITRRIGLTRLDPADVWAARCEAPVAACLAGLPAGTIDAGACGTYRQVQLCGGLTVGAPPAAARLADDLRAHLVGYYAVHDIASYGGNTLAQAQAAVAAGAFEEVTLAEEDPYAHDLGQYWVFRHPDVTFPGSDIVWFVVYDKATASLAEIYDFN